MRRQVVATLAALAAVIGASAASYPSMVVAVSDDVVRAPTGCPVLPSPEDVAEADRIAAVVPRATAPTATDHARAGVDLRGALADARSLAARFRPVADVVLPSSGMHVVVLSDGPLGFDADELDRLVRLPLAQPELFRNRRVAEVQRCYAERILGDRALDGHELRIVVPSDPASCFRAGRLVTLDPGAGAPACDSAGATVPEVSLRPRLLGLELAHARLPATVVVTAATPSGHRDPDGVLAGLLLHELHHVVENAFGLPPWSGSLRHYEQRAYYVEREVRRHLRERGLRLPRPIRFAESAAG